MSDSDGCTSTAQFYKYIKRFNENIKIQIILHKDKSHGLSDDVMRRLRKMSFDFLIIPDAGSLDCTQLEELYNSGKEDILIIDHHPVSKLSEHAVVINNSYSKISKNLSGAGLTFNFLKECDYIMNTDFANGLEDLMAIGMIADMMDVSDLEVSQMTLNSLDKFNSEFSKAIIKDKKITNVTPKDISFYFAPLINSICRTGTHEDKIELFKAMAYDKPFNLNSLKKVKERQDSEVKLFLENNQQNIEEYKNIVILKSSEQNGFSGLVGNKLSQKYRKPVLVITSTLKGSCRTPFSEDIDFKDILIKTGMFEYCLGHKNAFGIKVNSKFDSKQLNSLLDDYKLEKSYDIDFVLEYENANNFFISEIYENKKYFSKGIEEPKVIIKNIPTKIFELKSSFIEGRSMKNNCYYVKFFENIETINKIKSNKLINIICTVDINNFIGTKYQFVIEEFFFEEPSFN